MQAAQQAVAEAERIKIRAREAARTAEESGGINIVELLRNLDVKPGDKHWDSWINRGGTNSEAILAHIQGLQELTQSELARLIN